ncbi:MAG: B12-binding domain-containing radical SAM protein [Candidatus Helarchaeota archaeon]|nr:B12-binding domain-containing radical SAM protein [Candidatus Helarchaeota archaeon]
MKVALLFPNTNINRTIKIPFHPPYGLAILAAVVERAGYDVSVIDAVALNLNNKDLMTNLKEINPDVIGITTNILLAIRSLELCRLIQRQMPNVKLVLGGPWASAVYEMLLRKKYCDFVIVGEGEQSFIELMKALENGELPEKSPGITYLDLATNSIKLEPPCPTEDLDALPFPAWHLFPSPKKYLTHRRGKIFYPIMTSRGCPYQCNHCTKIIHGIKVRFRSVENVIAEIRYLKERFSIDEITIIDDNFTVNKKRAEKIIDEIIKNKFNLHIQFSNGLRADTLTPKFVRKLKWAGTYKIAIGVESGNQDVVNKIGKKLDLNAVRRAAQIIKREKIVFVAFFMIGHPWDTIKTMNDTINFALEIDPDIPLFFKAIGFPGTKLYSQIKRDGKFLMSLRDIDQGYNLSTANFEIFDLRAKDVEKMFKQAYRRFYLRPRKMLSLLTKIRNFSEVKAISSHVFFDLVRIMFF